jgi:AhpD family alkylhydroperoxidase
VAFFATLALCKIKKISARMSHRRLLPRHDVVTDRRKPIMTAQFDSKFDPMTAAPELMKSWLRTSMAVNTSLEPTLVELVKIRASQINGCANCINLHAVWAREHGETDQRLYLLPAWREAPCYTDRERAALGWTEALTRLSEAHTHESAYAALKEHFSEEEQVALTLIVNDINAWNRVAVGFGIFVDPAEVKAASREAVA